MRPEAMPTVAALLSFRETWLTLLFEVAMIASCLRMQGCVVAGMLSGLMCLRRQGVVEAELLGTLGTWKDELGRHNLDVNIGITKSGSRLPKDSRMAVHRVAWRVACLAEMCIQSYLSENETRHLSSSTPVGGALGTKLRQARCNTC